LFSTDGKVEGNFYDIRCIAWARQLSNCFIQWKIEINYKDVTAVWATMPPSVLKTGETKGISGCVIFIILFRRRMSLWFVPAAKIYQLIILVVRCPRETVKMLLLQQRID
jgi:hypothetical protein